jgi:voltage-gated potassium channel
MQTSMSRLNIFRRRFFRLIRYLARPNTYTVILFAMTVLLGLGTVLVWFLELDTTPTPGLLSVDDAFVFMLQNVSGVGIGANAPHSAAARYLGVTIVILAVGLRAIFVAAIVSSFVNRLILQGKGVRRVDMEKHVIICGWNPRVKQIVKTLRRDEMTSKVPVVLVAQISENPLVEYGVKFIKGDPSLVEDLDRAGVTTARSAIVITDESDGQHHADSTYDARGVLMVLALKSANPNLHVVAEVRDPANRQHFQHARADEVVVSAEVSEGVVARAATNQGIAWVYEDLLRLDTEPEMYIIKPPPEITGKSFQAALVRMNTRDNYILLGVVENSQVVMCPPNDQTIGPDTRLVVLGKLHSAIDR